MSTVQLTVVSIVDDVTKKKLQLQGNWSENGVKLLLNDGENTWKGEFNTTDVSDEFLSQLDTDRREYVNIMKNALGSSAQHDKYKFCFEDDSLTWYKNISHGVSHKQGFVPLIPVKLIDQGSMISKLLDDYSKALNESERQAALCRRYQKDLEEASAALKNCVETKKRFERELYSKFALLLNEKKEYVRRTTGRETSENFGPTLSLVKNEPIESNTTRSDKTVSLGELSNFCKHDGDDEPAFKKRALDPKPSTSGSSDHKMESFDY